MHGHVGLLRLRRRGRGDRDDPRDTRSRDQLPRHGRDVRAVREREADRQGGRRTSRRLGDRDQVRRPPGARRVGRMDAGARRLARERAPLGRGLARAPRDRPDRSLLPAPHGPERADRGDGRGDGRAGRGGQDPPHRAQRGGAGADPQGARHPSDHGGADGVLALDPRPRGGDPADPAGARDRPGPVLAARPRLPLRPVQVAGRARLRRLPPPRAAVHRREPGGEPRAGCQGRAAGRPEGGHPGAAGARLGPGPGRRHRPDPGHQAPQLPGAERRRARGRAHRRGPGADRRGDPARLRAIATTPRG